MLEFRCMPERSVAKSTNTIAVNIKKGSHASKLDEFGQRIRSAIEFPGTGAY